MRQRAVWLRRVRAYSWTEVHGGKRIVQDKLEFYDEGDWVEPYKRLHGSPFILEETREGTLYRPLREVRRERYAMLFVLRRIDTWDMFERMARAKHSEWRDDVHGPYLTPSQEEGLRRRGEWLFPPVYSAGQAAGMWEWSSSCDLKKWGLPHWIQVVLGSRWWSDRMGAGSILILPPKDGFPEKYGTWWERYKERAGTTFTLQSGAHTPCGVALELLRERDKKDSPVSILRFRAFAHRFWGEERARMLTEGIV